MFSNQPRSSPDIIKSQSRVGTGGDGCRGMCGCGIWVSGGDGRWEADVGGIVGITPRQPLLAQGEKHAETVQSSALVFASHTPLRRTIMEHVHAVGRDCCDMSLSTREDNHVARYLA